MVTRTEKVKAGVFLFSFMCMLIAFLLFVGYLRGKPKGQYYYSLFEDVDSINISAPVKYNGVEIGEVTAVSIVGVATNKVQVEYRVERPELIRKKTYAQLNYASPLAGTQYVSLASEVGPPGPDNPPLPPHSEVQSRKSDITVTFESLQISLEELSGVLTESRDKIGSLLDNTNHMVLSINALLTGARPDGQPVDEGLVAMRTDVIETIGRIKDLGEKAGKAVESGDKMFTEVHGAVSENREGLAKVIENLSETSKAVRGLSEDLRKALPEEKLKKSADDLGKSLGHLNQLAEQLTELAGVLQQTSGVLETVLDENRESLNATLENLERVSENLERFSNEMRRDPSVLFRSSPPPKRDVAR